MKKVARADVVIFGGGVAGLWLLDQIRKTGLSAILFESGYLGGGQTHKAQGILHGGAKYSLQGVMTSDAQAVNSMPEIWSACLAGRGETDLSGVSILSRQHFLWSPNKLTAKLTGFLAGAALSSKVSSVPRDQLPEIFKTTYRWTYSRFQSDDPPTRRQTHAGFFFLWRQITAPTTN